MASSASMDYSAPKKTPGFVGDEMKGLLGASLGSCDYSPAGANKPMATILPTQNMKSIPIPVQVVPFGGTQTGSDALSSIRSNKAQSEYE